MTKAYDHLEILNSFPDAVSIKDLEFRFVWVNKTITDILEIPLDQIVGKKCYELAYDLGEPCDGCPALIVIETGKQARNEITTVKGKVMDAIVDPIFDENGVLVQTIETSRNITDQRSIETRYSHFMSSATDSFSIFDKDLNYIDANQAALNRIGLSKEELIGKNLAEVFPDAEKKGRIAKYRELITTGKPVFFESITGIRAGQPSVFSRKAFKVGTGMGVITTDITDVKRLEESLRKSEAYYRAIFENTGTALVILEANSMIFRVNKRFETLTGYSRSEVEGLMNWTEFISPEYLETLTQYSVDRRNGKPVPLEYPCDIINKAGQVKHVLINVETIPETKQSAVSVLDITDRVQLEERLSAFMKSATDGFELFDSELHYTEINQVALSRLGLTREDVVGRDIHEIRPPQTDADHSMTRRFSQVIETGEPFTEFIPLTLTGSTNIRINVFKVNNGMGILSTDLTDLIESENALQQAEKRYSTLFQNSGEASFIHYIGSKFIETNKACSELLGYTNEELLTMSPHEIADIETPISIKEYTANINEKGKITRETRFVSKTGKIIEVELVSQLIHYQGRDAVLSVARDIGKRKQYEENLSTLHLHASRLAQAETLDKIYAVTHEAIKDVIEVDRVALGLILEEHLVYQYLDNARTTNQVKLPLEQKSISTRAINTGKTQLVNDVTQDPDFVTLTPERTASTMSELVVPVKQNNTVIAVLNLGKCTPNAFTVQDQRLVETLAQHIISAINRIQQTEQIQVSEERYHGLFDSLIDGFAYHKVIYNENGDPVNYAYVEINDRFTELVGLGRDIVGKNVTEILPGIEDDPADWIGVYGELAKNGGELRFEQYAGPLDKWFSVSAYSPTPGYFATIFQDITEQHKQKDHIAYLTQILLAIRNVNQLIVTEKDRVLLLQRSCELMVADKGYNGAWIALKTTEGPVSNVYGVGYGEKFTQFRENLLKGQESPCLTHIGKLGVQVLVDPSTFCEGCPLREKDQNVLCTTLRHEDKVYGMFVASVPEGMTGETERELFMEVADDIAFALHSIDLNEARTRAEKALEKRSHDLGERVKEMTCLYRIETLTSDHTQALPDVIQSIVELLPLAWQYPEETCAQITIRDHVHQTENYVETDWSQKETIIVNGETTGYVTVCYRSEMPSEDEGPFLRQERDLIKVVALKTGEIIGLRALQKHAERTASKLRESEALFRGFMQSATDAFTIFDQDMRFLDVNDSWLQMTGHEREDVIGKHMLDIYRSLKNTERYDAYLKVLETGEPVVFRAVQTAVGRGMIYDVSAFRTGGSLGIVARDVGDQIQHQRRLEALHGHARALSSAESMEEVAEITRDSLNEVLGFFEGGLGIVEGENLMYQNIWGNEIMKPFTMPLNGTGVSVYVVNTGVTQNIGDVRENPVFFNGIGTMKTLSELTVPVTVSGKVVGVVNVESERKNAFSANDQRLVETLASHISAAYSNIQYLERLDALHGFTVELGITESVKEIVNTSLRIMNQVLGFKYSSFQILLDDQLVMLGADGSDGVWTPLPLSGKGITTRAARNKQAVRVGDIRLDPDFIQGSTDSLSELAVPMVVENRVLGVLNVESLELDAFTDDDTKLLEMLASNVGSALHRVRASEEKAGLESELFTERIRSEQEQELSQLKTRFMNTATHEIRTPLSSILGYTELIQLDEGNLSETQRGYFDVIQRNVHRLTVLTDDLLDLQRLEGGRLMVNIEPVNIRDLVDGVESEFAPILAEKSQSLEVSCPDIVLNIDRLRIMQVLVNLLSNASKFSPEGSEITVEVVETGDGVLASVSDKGIGLSEEDLGKLFTPFPGILVDGNVSGTGLGLSICKGIVELHGGTIWAESDGIGCGSVFRFTLPTTR